MELVLDHFLAVKTYFIYLTLVEFSVLVSFDSLKKAKRQQPLEVERKTKYNFTLPHSNARQTTDIRSNDTQKFQGTSPSNNKTFLNTDQVGQQMCSHGN